MKQSFLKIWLLCVNFEKFTIINLVRNQSQSSIFHRCDWSLDKFIEVNFSKLTNNIEFFRNYFVCIRCHLCKISPKIIEC